MNIFGEPLSGGRRTGKMNTRTRELRPSKQDLAAAGALVKEVRPVPCELGTCVLPSSELTRGDPQVRTGLHPTQDSITKLLK